jgi:formate--tetrahydrofolate ligase
VSINHFTHDTPAEHALIVERMAALGVKAVIASHWANGGAGAEAVARAVIELAEGRPADAGATPLYDDAMPLWNKIDTVARTLYGAAGISASAKVRAKLDRFTELGFGHYPVCMAKTQSSFSTDPKLRGAPSGHTVEVREVRLAAGAEFVVAICGEIMTMPGLPKVPSAAKIGLGPDGKVVGLF